MIVSAELINVLARKVFQKYASDDTIVREVGDLLLGPDKLADGLTNLINNKLLKLGEATEPGDFRPELVDIVMMIMRAPVFHIPDRQ